MLPSVLVLEDDPTMRMALVDALEDLYGVHEAASASQALELARLVKFDLVVADVRMEEMDGLECLEHLRRLQPGIRSIVITGYASQDAPLRALQVQAEDYLHKPFSRKQLQEAVRRVLEARTERAGYLRLLEAVVTGCRWLADRAGQATAQRELAALEAERAAVEAQRDEVVRGFFVGVRSGALPEAEALTLWRCLERLDAQLEQAGTRDPGSPDAHTLLEDFRCLGRLVRAFVRAPADSAGGDDFSRLYERIRAGSVSSEQLILAPLLRRLEQETRSQSSDLEALFAQVWGDPTGNTP